MTGFAPLTDHGVHEHGNTSVGTKLVYVHDSTISTGKTAVNFVLLIV
jgi:hypothetical protein